MTLRCELSSSTRISSVSLPERRSWRGRRRPTSSRNFRISFALGFYVLHRLSRVREGAEHSERAVVQQFVSEAMRSLDQLSPIEGLRTVILLPFGRLRERRLKLRSRP